MEINNVAEITVKRELSKSQIVAETKLPAAEAVTKVLGVYASLTLSVTECFSGEVRISGSEIVNMTYLTESGIMSASASVDFTDRIECKASATTKARVSGRVLDTDIVAIDPDGVRLASVIEITVFELVAINLPRPELPGGVYANEKHLKCSSLAASFSAKSTVESDEVFKAESMLSACARAVVSGGDAALDTVIVTGDIIIDVCGCTGETTVSGELIVPFTEELPAPGARSGDIVCARGCVCKVSQVESSEGFTFAVTIQLDGEVYCKASADIVSDAFSVSSKLEKECKVFSFAEMKSSHYISEKTDGSIVLAEGDSADSVISLTGFEFITENMFAEFGKVNIDGALSGTIIYFDADAGIIKSANALLPVKLMTSVNMDEGDEAEASGSVGKISVKLRRSGEIDIKADIMLNILIKQPINETVIAGITEGEIIADAGGAISVYISGEGESLWDCAKALRVRPELISEQNAGLGFPLRRGEKIVVYRAAKE